MILYVTEMKKKPDTCYKCQAKYFCGAFADAERDGEGLRNVWGCPLVDAGGHWKDGKWQLVYDQYVSYGRLTYLYYKFRLWWKTKKKRSYYNYRMKRRQRLSIKSAMAVTRNKQIKIMRKELRND